MPDWNISWCTVVRHIHQKPSPVSVRLVLVVMLSVAGLKQGLHEGMSSDLRLMKESPRVQWMVEEGRRGRRRMRRMQGRRSRVEISIVVLSMRRPDL